MKKHNYLLFLLGTVISAPAFSAGFQLIEHSTSGLGRAFSGEGVMNDTAASGSRNPAAMALFDRPTMSTGLIYVRPTINLTGTSASGANLNVKNIAPNEIIPNAHFIYPVNDQWSFGLFGTSNYGLSTKFDKNYAAGSLAGETKLVTGNFNASAAFRFNEHLSAGFGLNAIYAKAKLVRHLGDSLSHLPLPIPQNTVISYLKGDKWGFGWNAGLLYEINDDHRFGLSYRAKVKLDFEGDFRNELKYGPKTLPGNLTLNLPDIWEFSGYHQLTQPFAVHYSIAYTKWNKFQELRGTNAQNGEELFFKDEQYSNSLRYSIGATYQYDDNWTFRGGFSLDKRASKSHPSISIPDQDRYWLSAGTTYTVDNNSSIDFGITHLFGRDITFTEKGPAELGGKSYEFSTDKAHAWLFGINYNHRF